MSNTYYTVKTELVNPWIGSAFIEYHLVKHWSQFVMDWPDHYGEDMNCQKTIFKSKNKDSVYNFLGELSK